MDLLVLNSFEKETTRLNFSVSVNTHVCILQTKISFDPLKKNSVHQNEAQVVFLPVMAVI